MWIGNPMRNTQSVLLKGQTSHVGVKLSREFRNSLVMTLRTGGEVMGAPKTSHLKGKSHFDPVISRLNKSKWLSVEQRSNWLSPLFYTEKQMD